MKCNASKAQKHNPASRSIKTNPVHIRRFPSILDRSVPNLPHIQNTSSNHYHYHYPVRETDFLISNDVCDDDGGDVRDDFQSHFPHIQGGGLAGAHHIDSPAPNAHTSSLPYASCASLPIRWLRSHPQLSLTLYLVLHHQLCARETHRLLLQVALLQGPSLRQGLVRHQGRSQHGCRCTEVGWDKLVRLRTEVEGMEVGTVPGPAEGMENLVVGMEVAVDAELGSVPENDLRNSAEAGIDFDGHPVVVCNLGRKDIGIGEDIVLEEGTVVDRKVVVDAGLRSSRCST